MATNVRSIISLSYKPLTRSPKRRITAGIVAAAANAASTKGFSSSESTPLTPYWQDFRLQVGRMEGLRGLPILPELQRRICASPAVAVRSGVFHSDRLRLGWFVFITLDGGRAVLMGALHPTVYSHHPPFVFELAFLEPAGWIVSFDFPRLFPSEDGFNQDDHKEHLQEEAQEESDLVSINVKETEIDTGSDLYEKLAMIKIECGSLAVPLPREFIESQRWMSPSACLLSSTQLPRIVAKGNVGKGSAATMRSRSREAFEGPALRAFKQALALHLNGLVGAPLEASPDAVDQVVQAHAEFAASRAGKEFLGSDVLETAFGPAWLSKLQSMVLDDAYGLSRKKQKKETVEGAGAEFYYINPRLR